MRGTLESWGHAVEVASDGAYALERAIAGDFDVIICDLRMPHLSGREMYQKLARHDPRAAERIIFATGDTVRGDTLQFLETLGRPYLHQPFTLAELRAAPRLIATRRVVFAVRRASPLFRADYIVAISEAVKAALVAAGVPPAEIGVVCSGIDPDEVRAAAAVPFDLRTRLGLPRGTPIAVNVAALEPAKDQATLVRAAQTARPLRPDLHWVIAGTGDERRRLTAQIDALGLVDRVHLLDQVAQADALIQESDVLVMPSRAEGLGSVVLHALALGKPVVATQAGGLPEIVPGEWLVPVGDAEALARKVVRALDHPSPFSLPLRFTARAMARGVVAVYRSLV